MIDIGAIILAAGTATRFSGGADGQTKLTALYRQKPLARYAVEAAVKAQTSPILVVTGHARKSVLDALRGLRFIEVYNPHFATGMASSLKAGIQALPPHTQAALVMLADMPDVSAALIEKITNAFEQTPDSDAIAPKVAGRRGNPVLLARKMFADVLALTGDEGARRLLANPKISLCEIAVDDAGATLDIDTPEALDQRNWL